MAVLLQIFACESELPRSIYRMGIVELSPPPHRRESRDPEDPWHLRRSDVHLHDGARKKIHTQAHFHQLEAGLHPSSRNARILVSYKLSFILPLAPLNARDLRRLTRNPGCDIWGKKDTTYTGRCTQCLTATYCGTGMYPLIWKARVVQTRLSECQRIDWNEHKKRCRTL